MKTTNWTVYSDAVSAGMCMTKRKRANLSLPSLIAPNVELSFWPLKNYNFMQKRERYC